MSRIPQLNKYGKEREPVDYSADPQQNCYNVGSYRRYEFEEEAQQNQQGKQQQYLIEQQQDEDSQQEKQATEDIGKYQYQNKSRKLKNILKDKKPYKIIDFTIKPRQKKENRQNSQPAHVKNNPISKGGRKMMKRKNGPEYMQESKYPPLFILRNVYPVSETKLAEIQQQNKVQPKQVNLLSEDEYRNYRLRDKIEMGLIDFADEAVMDREIDAEMEILVKQINGDIQTMIQLDQRIRFLKSTIQLDPFEFDEWPESQEFK